MAVVVVAPANEAMGDSAVVDGLVPVVVVDTVVLEVEISPRTVVSGAEKIAIYYDNTGSSKRNGAKLRELS